MSEYDVKENISKNLKILRKSRQLSLEELAERSGVSKSMLGEIERGRTNPTVSVLWKIAKGLNTPLTTLIKEQEFDSVVIRKSEYAILSKETEFIISSVFPYYEPHRLEILHLEISPHSKLDSIGHMKGVEEYLIVLDGIVNIYANGEQVTLHPNDAFRFKADSAHGIQNLNDKQAKLLNIIYYR